MVESNERNEQQAPSARKKKVTKKRTIAGKQASKANEDVGGAVKQDSESSRKNPPQVSDRIPSPGNSIQSETTAHYVVGQAPGQSIQNGSGEKIISWIALLLSSLALCAGGYAWYLTAVDSRINVGQQENRIDIVAQRIDGFDTVQSDINNQISQLKTRIGQTEDSFSDQVKTFGSDLAEQDSAIRGQILNSEQNIKSQTDNFRQEFSVLSESIIKLRSELGRSIDSWTLEEAEQLMAIANQRLHFAGDTRLAKRALQFADGRLQQLGDPALNDVRQLLATEITALDGVDVINVNEVVNSLSTLSSSVDGLSLVGDIVVPEKVGSGSGAEASESGAEQSDAADAAVTGIASYTRPIIDASASFLASLGDLIQVEKNGKSVRPIISAESRQLTYQKTKLILESAQIAFIRDQPKLFQNRIQNARNWVVENFDLESEKTTSWLAQLDDMASKSPRSALPEISGSLNAIREIIKSGN